MKHEDYKNIAAAIRRQNEIDFEDAGPKAPYDVVGYKGVRLESRWNVIDEFALMRKMVDTIPEFAGQITWIWCDSNCGANYVVGVRPGMFTPHLKYAIGDAFRKVGGGHNGIAFEDGDSAFVGTSLDHLDPDWDERL